MVQHFGPKAVCAVGLGLVDVGPARHRHSQRDHADHLAPGVLFIQGAGMANVMPPATESIMASVPREKAGVGSAVQNTVAAARRRARRRGARLGRLQHLPARDRRRGGRAATRGPVSRVGVGRRRLRCCTDLGPGAPALIASANDAFVTAMHWAAGISAVFAILGIVVVLIWLPRRSPNLTPPAGSTVDEHCHRRRCRWRSASSPTSPWFGGGGTVGHIHTRCRRSAAPGHDAVRIPVSPTSGVPPRCVPPPAAYQSRRSVVPT